MQNDRAKFKNVVRGFSLVRTTLKGRTTKFGGEGFPDSDGRAVVASPSYLSLRVRRLTDVAISAEIPSPLTGVE